MKGVLYVSNFMQSVKKERISDKNMEQGTTAIGFYF